MQDAKRKGSDFGRFEKGKEYSVLYVMDGPPPVFLIVDDDDALQQVPYREFNNSFRVVIKKGGRPPKESEDRLSQ